MEDSSDNSVLVKAALRLPYTLRTSGPCGSPRKYNCYGTCRPLANLAQVQSSHLLAVKTSGLNKTQGGDGRPPPLSHLYYQLVMLPLWSPCIKYEALILRPRRVNDQILPTVYSSLKLYCHNKPLSLIRHIHVEFTLHYLAKSHIQGISESMASLNQIWIVLIKM